MQGPQDAPERALGAPLFGREHARSVSAAGLCASGSLVRCAYCLASAVDVIEHVFYVDRVLRPDDDRLRLARIAGVTRRHALAGPLTGEREAAALRELAEVADGRVDLLAERAGLALGFHEGDIDAAVYERIAQLCISAGASIADIEGWIGVGRQRAVAARQIPASRPGRRPR